MTDGRHLAADHCIESGSIDAPMPLFAPAAAVIQLQKTHPNLLLGGEREAGLQRGERGTDVNNTKEQKPRNHTSTLQQ